VRDGSASGPSLAGLETSYPIPAAGEGQAVLRVSRAAADSDLQQG
jgi:hypothetical protein